MEALEMVLPPTMVLVVVEVHLPQVQTEQAQQVVMVATERLLQFPVLPQLTLVVGAAAHFSAAQQE
jgi:hypothetical protein